MSSTKTPSTRKAAAAVDIQADEPRRLTRKGKPSWEVLVERLEYNMPAWNASNWIVKHNIKIIRNVQHIQDYELGKRSDPPPFSFAELLNPRVNAREPSRTCCFSRRLPSDARWTEADSLVHPHRSPVPSFMRR